MAKGAGMLAPQLATMLVVLTTDAVVDADDLDAALRAATRVSFDRLDSDGCMSTNDTVAAAGQRRLAASRRRCRTSPRRVTRACTDLAMQLLADAEGADHEIAITVPGRGHRGRRRRGRPQHRPQQPVQGRRLRQRPQLGPRARLASARPARRSTPPTSTSR